MLYESIDAVFNNQNFWINMHPSMPIKDINFDEMESKNWEYVMLDTIQFNENLNDEENDMNLMDEDNIRDGGSKKDNDNK